MYDSELVLKIRITNSDCVVKLLLVNLQNKYHCFTFTDISRSREISVRKDSGEINDKTVV